MAKQIYSIAGEAIDQEAIIRIRPQIEDYVRENHIDFTYTSINWNMNNKDFFDFVIKFWA